MENQANDREKVAFALKTEGDGNDFYRDATKRTNHKLARAAFEMLAKEELRHVALIEALGKRLEGVGGLIEPDSPSLTSLGFSIKSVYQNAIDKGGEGDLDPAEAYKKAIELEERISALYFGYAKDCESDEAKHLFGVLYREEQDHLSLLQDMLGYLTNPDEWFIDQDGTMLDGG
jgi:rubrerythrin